MWDIRFLIKSSKINNCSRAYLASHEECMCTVSKLLSLPSTWIKPFERDAFRKSVTRAAIKLSLIADIGNRRPLDLFNVKFKHVLWRHQQTVRNSRELFIIIFPLLLNVQNSNCERAKCNPSHAFSFIWANYSLCNSCNAIIERNDNDSAIIVGVRRKLL